MIDPKDIVALIPTALQGAKAIAGLVSPRAAEAIGFGGDVAQFVIEAEANGASPEAITQGVADLAVQLVKRLKLGA